VRLPAAALLVADLLAAGDAQKPVVTAYRNAYEKRYKQRCVDLRRPRLRRRDALPERRQGRRRTDKAKVRDALEATKGYVGTGGVVNMSATDHMGLDLSAFRMLEVKGGTWSLAQ
jgi:branched-chain amino acid transport system substrate-binding protein